MGISADVEGDAVEPIHTTDEVEDEAANNMGISAAANQYTRQMRSKMKQRIIWGFRQV